MSARVESFFVMIESPDLVLITSVTDVNRELFILFPAGAGAGSNLQMAISQTEA